VQDMRNAVRLNVINGYSLSRAAEEANAASESVKAGLSARITRCDVDRYGEEFRDALETDPSLCIAKSSLMEALKSNSRDREAPAVVTARGIFENIRYYCRWY
jgi:hypothetical protein